ncbi:uncharacterized protein BN523_00176 [Bacteroides sp. CAG:189]|nr:uncharacterized protein BN523_00176 [Bacteroides sp. CAG:189]
MLKGFLHFIWQRRGYFGINFVLLNAYAKKQAMRRLVVVMISLFWGVLSVCAGKGTDTILVRLDKVLGQQQIYMKQKEGRIDSLKRLLARPSLTLQQKFRLNKRLGTEYELFVSDSAMAYFDRSLLIADSLHNVSWADEIRLCQVSVLSVSGMYKEAWDRLHGINRTTLPDSLLPAFYNCGRQLNSFLASYSHDSAYVAKYAALQNKYRDSLLTVLSPALPEYRLYEAERFVATRQYMQAKKIFQELVHSQPEESNVFARAAFSLAQLYRDEGRPEEYEKYLILSTISDIKASVKENAALPSLAFVLYGQGDITRAYHYIKRSLEDAIFCNARLRTIEISGMLPVIDAAYKLQIERQRRQLVLFLIIVSLLSVFLIISVVLIYKQVKKLSVARRHLRQANHIKEEYIGHFLNLCSLYIEKLDNFRRTVNRKITAGQTEELLKLTKSSQFAGMEQKEFYANFDNAFLHLYPDFVTEFNRLLQPEERFIMKPGELLNTELRIFAIIRLGIDDSSKIANFLHYSINTIYTYRNKVKNKAINRENFEEEIMKIGVLE